MFCPLEATSLSLELMSSFFVVLLGNNSFLFFSFMGDLTKNWSNLSLNEREGVGFTLRNQFRSAEFIIAAKVFDETCLKHGCGG